MHKTSPLPFATPWPFMNQVEAALDSPICRRGGFLVLAAVLALHRPSTIGLGNRQVGRDHEPVIIVVHTRNVGYKKKNQLFQRRSAERRQSRRSAVAIVR